MPAFGPRSALAELTTVKWRARQASTLLAQFMVVEGNGSLAQRVREVIASNRRKALKAGTSADKQAPSR